MSEYKRQRRPVPALISLMKTRDPGIESLALAALCGPGHKGATAFPYIEKRLRGTDSAFDALAYPVLVCMGDIAKPAIAILIRKSVSPSTADTSGGNDAIAALGDLAQYEPEQVMPHLIRVLDQPAHIEAAAKALKKNGSSARVAQEPLIQKLSVAASTHQGDLAAVLISALTSVGDSGRTGAVLSALLEHPDQTDPYSRAAEPPTITVSANRANLGSGVLRFASSEKKDRCSLVDLGDQCWAMSESSRRLKMTHVAL
jgi:hypothetical protein